MKKLFFLAVMLTAVTVTQAQISVKPMAGLTYSTVTDGGWSYKPGLVAGGELEVPVTGKFSFTGGLLYSMQGAKDGDWKFNLEYLNIPVLANVYVISGLALKAGLQLGIRTKGELGYDDLTVNIDDYLKGAVVDIPVGISYQFSDFVVDARYNFGLTNVADEIEGYEIEGKNSVFMLTLGYKIPLK